jgi:hypothetical protein
MTKKVSIPSALLPDPVGDALADVYTFLLRKAAERKRAITATPHSAIVAGTVVAEVDCAEQDSLIPNTLDFANETT